MRHSTGMDRLSQRYGITGTVQEWFASYLSSRTQFVQIESSRSSLRELNCGVPQGSVLGPLLYVLYTSPVADIIKRHNLYADDTQLYVSFKLGSDDLLSSIKSSIEICVQEINNSMILNGLKLNEVKPSCFYSVHVIGPVLHWNLFVLGVKLFKHPLLFKILGWYSISVLIWKTTLKRSVRHVISI